MQDTFKTEPLLLNYLPAIASKAPSAIRWHFADMAHMPILRKAPESVWGSKGVWTDRDENRGCSMLQAIKMMKAGWPDGADQARRLREGVRASLPQRAQLARYGVAGAVPNVARAIAGNPLHMRRIAMKATAQRPVLTLVCDVSVNWDFPADGMLSHAAAVAAVVDFLESERFRCEVIVVARTTSDRLAAEIAIRLKAPDQPVNLSVMAYGLGHAGFFRRLLFSLLWADPDCAPLGFGLGHPAPCTPDPSRGTFTVGPASGAGTTVQGADRFRYILTELARQGCPGVPQGQDKAA